MVDKQFKQIPSTSGKGMVTQQQKTKNPAPKEIESGRVVNTEPGPPRSGV
tara:strand:+ start:3655 stop:3804 length:150 start_codon:yes stop_codon:yes gene_type:complete